MADRELLASRSDQPRVWTVPAVLDAPQCRQWIEASEARGYVDAPITTPRGPVQAPEIRNNTRVIWDDRVAADELFAGLKASLPESIRERRLVGLNERFRLYRYDPGQYFDWHRDGAFRRSLRERSYLTVLVYLSQPGDDYGGGETEFSHHPTPSFDRGDALVFEHGLMHRGAPVTGGVKYVLRTDAMYRYES